MVLRHVPAIANAAEALRDWIEATEEGGEVVPSPGALEDLRCDSDVAGALAGGASFAIRRLQLPIALL